MRDLRGKKVLFVRLSSLGDLILVLPTFHAIRERYPDAYIAWLVQDSLREVIEGTPGLNEVIPVKLISITDKYANWRRVLEGGVSLLKALSSTRRLFQERAFDVVLDFQGLWKSGLFVFLNRRAERYGFRNSREFSHLFLTHPIFVRDSGRHAIQNYLEFARYFGCKVDRISFPLHVPPEAQRRVDALLRQRGIGPKDPLAFICATARWQTKFWTQEGFAQVADSLQDLGFRVVLSGLPQERDYLEGMREKMRGEAVNVAGEVGIKDFFALLKRSKLYVGVDSGAMHVASALGVPVVALFGPSNPRWIGPYGERTEVVRVPLPCSPCNRRKCSDLRCMKEITPGMVLEAIDRVLRGSSRKASGRGAGSS